jgi:hypothetical protein
VLGLLSLFSSKKIQKISKKIIIIIIYKNMPKNPYLVENKKPVELVQELKDYEIKKSPLSPAARSKVIRKWGSDYASEDREGYGPCTSSNCTHSRSELQEQLRELERRLRELENSVNLYYYRSEITVIQQNITIILGKLSCLPGTFYWEAYLQESTNKDLLNWTGNSNSRWQSDRRDHPNFNLGLTWDRNPNFGRNEWYTNETFKIGSIETARKVLRWMENGWLFFRAGFFMGADYDDVCRNNTVAAISSLRRAIERCENGEDVDVREYYTFYT